MVSSLKVRVSVARMGERPSSQQIWQGPGFGFRVGSGFGLANPNPTEP